MSAEVLGKAVLQDVHTESLADLLLTLRNFQTPDSKYTTGVELLDKIIDGYWSPDANDSRTLTQNLPPGQDETFHTARNPAIQYSDDLQVPNTDSELTATPLKPLLVNITLAKPGSRPAASHLLNHLTALSTIPYAEGGKQGCVVWIDLSNNFSAKLLYKHILYHLTSKTSTEEQEPDPRAQHDESAHTDTPNDPEAHAKQLLQHTHVIRCTSTRHLQQTLQTLASYLFDLAENQSADKPCTLLVIDGINQFRWIDQFDAEIARLQGPTSASRSSSNNNTRTVGEGNIVGSILSELRDFSSRFQCPIVYTSHPIQSTTSSPRHATSRGGASGMHSPGLITPIISSDRATKIDPFHAAALFTLSPVSAAVNVPQFGHEMTIEMCLRDQEKRAEVVRESCARWWFDVKRGGAATRHGAARAKTGFWMRADSTGIVFEQSS